MRSLLSGTGDGVLRATGLSLAYTDWRRRRHWVLRELDWSVTPGQTTLLLGKNGAGKSTLMRVLSGFQRPTAGTVSVGGRPGRDALYAGVGWMPQEITPGRGLRVREQLEYAAWLAGATRRDSRALAQEAVGLTRLTELAETRADQLSGGQLRRLGLGQAWVRRSPVLLLDEPTAGLDPAQAEHFRDLLGELDCPGGVVISTHQIDELADEVDRLAVLDSGRICFDGTTDEFLERGVELGAAGGSLASVFARMLRGGTH